MLTMRPTRIAGEKLDDDFVVFDEAIEVGRILRQIPGASAGGLWGWSITFPHLPAIGAGNGAGDTLDDAKAAFRAAWDQMRAHYGDAIEQAWQRRR
jgi:hypothetical protein